MSLSTVETDELLKAIKFEDRGMVAAIVLDHVTGEPLMFAFMNAEALTKTLNSGKMHYWSRSRGKLWLKGETSGHTQAVRGVRTDCDGDALVFEVEQSGGACHKGYRSCFYRKLGPSGWEATASEKVFDPDKVY